MDKLSQVFIIENRLSFYRQKVLFLEINAVLQRSSYQHKRVVKGGVAKHYTLSERKRISSSRNIIEKLTLPSYPCSSPSYPWGWTVCHTPCIVQRFIFLAGAESFYSLLICLLCLPFEPCSSFISSCKPQASFHCSKYLCSEPDSFPGLFHHLVAGKVSRRRSELREVAKYLFQPASDCRERLDVT